MQTLNRDVFALAEYINAFQTPWIRYKSQSIMQYGFASQLEDKDLLDVQGPRKNTGDPHAKDNETTKDFYVGPYMIAAWDDSSDEPVDVRLMMNQLTFREYVINENIENNIVLNAYNILDSSIIGYYISLAQTPIDSSLMRAQYASVDQYLIIPFSNGSYYSLVNPFTARNQNDRHFTWKYVREAIDILGYSNIFNYHYWPCRFAYQELISPAKGALVYNWVGNLQLKVKDAANIAWTTAEETIFSEFYYDDEEIIMDGEWAVQQTKLLNTTQMGYNIVMKNETPR